jgi:nicotinamidase/pyrazinamidase
MNALLVVDIQNDFLPGGALAVPEGDAVVPIINRLMKQFELVIATQDWHPPDHGSFAANHPGRRPGEVIDLDGISQILWPVHCVQHTSGARFASGLETTRISQIIQKGIDPRIDSYSTFFDNARRRSTGLEHILRERGVDEVTLCGLATDYCVKYSALDAISLGFKVTVIEEACRGVNLQPDDSEQALALVRKAGGTVVRAA